MPSTETGRGSLIKSSSFGDKVTQRESKVKQNFSVDDAYLSAVEEGNMERDYDAEDLSESSFSKEFKKWVK